MLAVKSQNHCLTKGKKRKGYFWNLKILNAQIEKSRAKALTTSLIFKLLFHLSLIACKIIIEHIK